MIEEDLIEDDLEDYAQELKKRFTIATKELKLILDQMQAIEFITEYGFHKLMIDVINLSGEINKALDCVWERELMKRVNKR